jgi:transposase
MSSDHAERNGDCALRRRASYLGNQPTVLRSIGPDFATLLVREAFVRQFRSRRALAGYVGLGGTPFSSGGGDREQGIGKDGNRRVRAAMVELAWMWLRQPLTSLRLASEKSAAYGGSNLHIGALTGPRVSAATVT